MYHFWAAFIYKMEATQQKQCGVKHSYTNNGENNLSKDAQIVTQNTPNTCNIYHKLNVKVNFKVSEVFKY